MTGGAGRRCTDMTHTRENRTAVVHGAGGSLGGGVARAFAAAGARAFLADTATFLAGDGAAAITGTIVNVTAGLVLR